jgi:beta-N-acetylhexosaminidase
MITCPKHFPGDGIDERDQHVSFIANSLTCKAWDAAFGVVYAAMIEAGVHSVMTGHIMRPVCRRHFNPRLKDADMVPATLSKELITDLLRGKLGFNGLVVTDASHMLGSRWSRTPSTSLRFIRKPVSVSEYTICRVKFAVS